MASSKQPTPALREAERSAHRAAAGGGGVRRSGVCSDSGGSMRDWEKEAVSQCSARAGGCSTRQRASRDRTWRQAGNGHDGSL
ncbi:Os04g0190100 [Oryza sativa Japonica Group]|uniref:Os04g0190100 protein n=1 Tax=Oryza sativa subsp. japonica TaxID=39947 RepID=A0A0P0W776_ORYSJ|nr:Os04g0190100 [Oryza sativa Japonica Group]